MFYSTFIKLPGLCKKNALYFAKHGNVQVLLDKIMGFSTGVDQLMQTLRVNFWPWHQVAMPLLVCVESWFGVK